MIDASPRKLILVSEPADIAYRSIARTGGIIVLVIMTGIGVFLALRAGEAISKAGVSFLWKQAWEPDANNFGIAAVLIGTLIIALVAIVIALPLSVGTALYISEYAPLGLQRTLISLVDLMAAIPSVVFGLWGFFSLQGNVIDVAKWISKTFGWIPFLAVDGFSPDEPLSSDTVFTASSFVAGIVVALMITPIMTSIMREVFSQAPGGGLSGGQQQRLCIARSLAVRPRVLLMDEPCSALDPTSTRRIEATITELAREVTIVIVTHNMQQAARVSDQTAFFLAEQGTPGHVVEHGDTSQIFEMPKDSRTLDYVNGRFG